MQILDPSFVYRLIQKNSRNFDFFFLIIQSFQWSFEKIPIENETRTDLIEDYPIHILPHNYLD